MMLVQALDGPYRKRRWWEILLSWITLWSPVSGDSIHTAKEKRS